MKFLKLTIVFLSFLVISFSCKKKEVEIITPKTTFVQVAAITRMACAPCHVANSGASYEARKKLVDNYEITKGLASVILDRIQRESTMTGFMPRGKAKLADAEIAVVKAWIADGLLEK